MFNIEVMAYSPGDMFEINNSEQELPILPRHKIIVNCLKEFTGQDKEEAFQIYLASSKQTEEEFNWWLAERERKIKEADFKKRFIEVVNE